MTYQEILKGNLFAECSDEELGSLWLDMIDFYEYKQVKFGSMLDEYRRRYCAAYLTGIVVMEQDLLRAIACRHFSKNNS